MLYRAFYFLHLKPLTRVSVRMSASDRPTAVGLHFIPTRCHFDDTVQVIVRGLFPKQMVKLVAEVEDDKGMIFRSSAVHRATEHGEVDLNSSPSLGGTYNGTEPMGLFWSLGPLTPHNKFTWWDASRPVLVDVKVVSHERPEHVLAKETHQRRFMKEGVQRVVVTDGRIRGTLFIPPGPGPFPGIVDLYTLGGGPSEPRASLLANKGFVVLALAFYRYKDLPKKVDKLDLEYFEEGVRFLQKHPKVKGSGVGVISISKSGDLALSMASFLSGIKAVVTINGCCANTLFPLKYKDTIIPALMGDLKKVTLTEQGLLDISKAIPDPTANENLATVIPVECADCNFMFVASEDDMNWDSVFFAELAAQRLRDSGKENFEIVRYPKAGHFVDVPYMPFYPSGVHAAVGKVVTFGGEAKTNAHAQVELWGRVQEFFQKHLDTGNAQH
ncbi:acyl-coenzyme A thioesterase 1-like [Alosa sapidissima]|uniref:acyl-coenzyme A thioesterase 1-like n=1 Tax=Alosa sapidissima TaxID=34773 RepID=UPI001C08EB96|nr:acyl-coenzyme A thioesterase 1-like [Alosa sapidissima]